MPLPLRFLRSLRPLLLLRPLRSLLLAPFSVVPRLRPTALALAALTVVSSLPAQIVFWRDVASPYATTSYVLWYSIDPTTTPTQYLVTALGYNILDSATGTFGTLIQFPPAIKLISTSAASLNGGATSTPTFSLLGQTNRLFGFDLATGAVTSQPLLAGVGSPQALLPIAPGSALLVADGNIYRISNTATGARTKLLSTGTTPTGASFGSGGVLYLLTDSGTMVRSYLPSGSTYTVGPTVTLPSGGLGGFAVSLWGNFYVGDGHGGVSIYTSSGTLLQTFSDPIVYYPDSQLRGNVQVTRDGTITVGDIYTYFQAFDASAFSGPVRILNRPYNAATDAPSYVPLLGSDSFSGTDGIVNLQAGTLTLTGTNTYSGLTGVRAGTLIFGNAGALSPNTSLEFVGGTLKIDDTFVPASGTLRTTTADYQIVNVDTNGKSVELTINGGPGTTLTASGGGTLTIPNATTFTGATTIAATTTLQVGNGATAGSLGATAIANAGTLVFDRSDASTFSGTISGAGNVTKNGAGTLVLSSANTFSGTTTVTAGTLQLGDSLTLQNSTLTTTAGSSSVNFGSLTSLTLGGLAGSGNVTFTAGLLTIGSSSTGTAAFTGLLTAAALTKTGSGTLTLSNPANTFSGVITLTSGTLASTASGALGTGSLTLNGGTLGFLSSNQTHTPTFTITSASTIDVASGLTATLGDAANDLTGSGALTKTGSGTLALGFSNNFSGGFTLTGGTLSVSADANLGTATSPLTFNGGTLQIIGTSFNNFGTHVVNLSSFNGGLDVATAANTFTISSAIGGTGNLTKLGAGTLVLSGTNTYSGSTAISAGRLSISNSSALGSGTSLTLSGNGTLVSTTAMSLTKDITLGSGGGTFENDSGFLTFSGNVTGTGGLTKTGSRIFTLLGAHTYTGNTTVSAGTFKIGDNGAVTSTLTTPLIDIASGALVIFTNSQSFAGNVTGAGVFEHEGSGTTIMTGNATHTGGTTIIGGTIQFGNGGTTGYLAGNATLSSSGILAFNRSDAITYSGSVSGVGTVLQSGSGSATFTGNVSPTNGTNVNAGTLLVNGTLGGGPVAVAGGATLGGSGTIAAATTFAGLSHVSPGNSPGTLTFSSGLTLSASMVFDFQLGTTPGTSDKIVVSGGQLTGPTSGLITFNLTNSGDFGLGTYHLLNYSAASGTTSFDATDFQLGTVIPGYSYTFALSGGNLDLVASAIPEPSTYALATGLLALAATTLRRRNPRAPR